ncbi:type I-F CRISPR-associated protein Csy2 [Zooshikella sp. RANM57]|uniref:type I-F CRISPR-associated protein Csy2 n=1 Tax=Zooshikella sp. RANM57 TaxID=3425863 RepID=UPI003D6F0E9B
MIEVLNGLLVVPRLYVQNANAVSSPLTWGFPAPSAFLGFVHALQRKLANINALNFSGVGIICHHFEPQTDQNDNRRTQLFKLTRNPLNKDGSSPAFIEEGRTHIEVSLLIGIKEYLDEDEGAELADSICHLVQQQRLAGGSVWVRDHSRDKPYYLELADHAEGRISQFNKIKYTLLPGYALIGRDDLLQNHYTTLKHENDKITLLEAWLDLSRLNMAPVPDSSETVLDDNKPVKWQAKSKPGWLVPIPVGYQGISELFDAGSVQHSRDDQTPFRFVESVYSIGEWLSPHKVKDPLQLLWSYQYLPEYEQYRCINYFNR